VSRCRHFEKFLAVIPAKAGIQLFAERHSLEKLDPGFRRDDGISVAVSNSKQHLS